MMVCVEKETTEFGRFLTFETLTLCPIDTTLVVKEMLSEAELSWLNNYHQKVREELEPVFKGR
jgi:Xaa-Pro aminopeptidase